MIGQLIAWGPMIYQTYKTLRIKDPLERAQGLAKTSTKIHEAIANKGTSLEVTKSIIAPLTVFEESLTHQSYMLDLMTIINMRDIRDALTHISYQGKMGDIEISKLIDSVSPNRTAGFMCLQGCEAFEIVVANGKGRLPQLAQQGNANSKPVRTGTNVRSDEFKNLTEYVPLALGRTVTASVFVDGKELTFPLTFRQIPIPASTENLMLMFQSVIGGAGWTERIKEYKAGGITRPELLTGVDVIKREFKIRNNDLSGYYNEANQRDRMNRTEGIRTGTLSMNGMANTIIMTKETSRAIELEMGIRFGSSKMSTIRKHVKANTIVLVDEDRGVFEFYSSVSNIVEKFTASQIKTKVNKENVDSLDSLIKLLNGR